MADPRPPQTYATHSRIVPGYHYVLYTLLLAATVGAAWDLQRAIFLRGNGRLGAAVVVLLCVAGFLLAWYTRIFALKAQDRAIRAEENLRSLVLTGKPLDPRITVGQTIALRFASDAELPELARRAAEEGLAPKAIKEAIRSWRGDYHRV